MCKMIPWVFFKQADGLSRNDHMNIKFVSFYDSQSVFSNVEKIIV